MKRIIAILTIVVLVSCLLCTVALAAGVDSPIDIPDPPVPLITPDIPDDPVPLSPQTGVTTNIILIIAAAVVALGVAAICVRKAFN